jgi:type IV pilus assembly protein PilB
VSIAVEMSKDSDAGGPDAEDLVTYPVTPIAVSEDSETIEPVSEDSQTSAPVPEEPVQQKPVSMHWLVRVAERAGLEGDRPTVPPDVNAKEAWPVVTRAYELSDEDLCKLVATYFRLDVADFAGRDQNAPLLVPEAMARRHHVYPLYETDRHLLVATCDPTQVEAERALSFSTGRTTVFQLASPQAIQELLDDRFSPELVIESILGDLDFDEIDDDAVKLVEEMGPESVSEEDAAATPVVKLTNLIISDAIAQSASDIHIEPGRRIGVIRYRVDGVLRKHMDLPMAAMNRVISRIRILSELDIADRLRPQDGKAHIRVQNLAYDLRVSTIPAGRSDEKCVIRILDSNAQETLDDLSLATYELERLRQVLQLREGIVLVTGPTGSGKTTTLYGALRELADGKVNIMTVEDPVEYELAQITQTQVEVKQGVTFGTALRAILRQDPDVILVGEIRDKETAETATHAAMTGHLVLATVHANDAVSAVARMADMGLPYSTIAATLRGAIAQRLLRRICSACAEPVRGELTPDEQRLTEQHEAEPVVRAVGCLECGFTGYKGRIPVNEVMLAGPRFQTAVEARKGWQTLHRLAIQGGMRTMHQVALDWVAQGKTTLVEVERALGQRTNEEEVKEDTGPTRILVVDDDEEARLMAASILEREGYEVSMSKDGYEAVERLKADPGFSLVILDLTMPGMDGRAVLDRIRGSKDTEAIPVLVSTAFGGEAVETELLEAGADDFLKKTGDARRFLARVKAVLRRAVM